MRRIGSGSLLMMAVAAIAALALPNTAVAQGGATRVCTRALEDPSGDSVSLRARFHVHAVDRSFDLPDWFQEDVGERVRGALDLPRPLEIDTYEVDSLPGGMVGHQTLRAMFRATLTRGGRIVDAHVIGGARNNRFDRAVIDAMRALDSSGQMKASAAEALSDSATAIVFLVTSVHADGSQSAVKMDGISVTTSKPRPVPEMAPAATRSDSGISVPLFAFRVPAREVTQRGRQIEEAHLLYYPTNLLTLGVMGDAVVSYVIGANGRVDTGTATAIRADHFEFLRATLVAMPEFKFEPLRLGGCEVRWIVEQSLSFRINR